jgi:hypothetical protein
MRRDLAYDFSACRTKLPQSLFFASSESINGAMSTAFDDTNQFRSLTVLPPKPRSAPERFQLATTTKPFAWRS